MEIVSIEAKTFEEMVRRMENMARMMNDICNRHREKVMGEWMDNQETCLLLDVSPRTLQTLRNNGTLAYSQISHKIYYRPEDVRQVIPLVEQKKRECKLFARNGTDLQPCKTIGV